MTTPADRSLVIESQEEAGTNEPVSMQQLQASMRSKLSSRSKKEV